LAISTEADKQIFDELPGRIQTELFVDFLFKSFIDRYKQILEINQTRFEYKRKSAQNVPDDFADRVNISQIDWTKYYADYSHDDFIVGVLRCLEPIKLSYGKLIQRQEQEITEVYFPMRGEIHIGYNHKRYLQNLKIEEIEIPFENTDKSYPEIKGRV